MPNKTPPIVSAILTMLLLLLVAGFVTFFEMVALNGASERQGTTALIFSLACQGVGLILLAMFAGWLTNLMIAKFHWNKILAVVIAVIAGTFLGSVGSFLAMIIAIPVAGIR
jgi:hypothetical protein